MAKEEHPKDKGPQPPFPPQTQQPSGRESKMRPRPDYGEESYHGFGRLAHKVALVTGADSGIGRAVALAFAREGADVVIAYLDEHEDAREAQRAVEAAGRRALLVAGDLADEAHCRRVVERTFRVNVMAMFHLIRHALPHLEEGAAIINTASIQAYQPKASILDYAATKGAIVTFTKGLAQELIERGVRVNCVAPGPVWTPLVVASFDADKNARFGQDSPMGRPAQPVELAPAFVFLACDESRYVNGEVLGVTGGKPLA